MAGMADKLPDGFLSKPDALEKHQKPERTFQRRLAKALLTRDAEFLNHFYLVTSDGEVRKGTDVAEGEVERLKNKGLYPVWHVEEEWFATEYDNKATIKVSGKAPNVHTATSQSAPSKDRSSFDREALVTEIESLNRELVRERKHNETIEGQLVIKDEQIKASNKIVLESNEREKEYTQLLKEITERLPRIPEVNPPIRIVTPEEMSVPVAPQQVTPVEGEIVKETATKPSTTPKQRKTVKKKHAAPKKKTGRKKTQRVKWYNRPIKVSNPFSR